MKYARMKVQIIRTNPNINNPTSTSTTTNNNNNNSSSSSSSGNSNRNQDDVNPQLADPTIVAKVKTDLF